MPLEIELLIAAWDNAKKNVFAAEDDMEIDAISGEVDYIEEDDARAAIVADMDDLMAELVAHYREYADTEESVIEF
jgi:hypothetical protein